MLLNVYNNMIFFCCILITLCLSQLLQTLKTVNFTYNGRTLYFDSKGDASTGYDVVIWKMGPDGNINIAPFAEYDTQKAMFIFSTKDKENEFKLLKVRKQQQASLFKL